MQSDGSYLRADAPPDDHGAQARLMEWLTVDHPTRSTRRRRKPTARYARRPAAALPML
jgi:hypothetical protein